MILPTQHRSRTLIIVSLGAVYFIWGSTFLALRFGLEGFPPFLLNGLRFTIAGVFMYVVLRMRGVPFPTPRQWRNSALVGSLLLVGGVGLMTIAEDLGVGSGVAATAAAAIPVWTALTGGLFGHWPVRREWIGLAVGLIGVIVLVQEGDFRASTLGTLLVITGPFLWAFGSVWSTRLEMPEGFMAPTAQLLTAGVIMVTAGPVLGERITGAPTKAAWLALVYLIVMGSIVAYTAYVYLLRTVRPALATSHAYFNPVVAVALGLTLGAEIITGPILLALPLILAGVGLVATTMNKSEPGHSPPIPGTPAPMEETADHWRSSSVSPTST